MGATASASDRPAHLPAPLRSRPSAEWPRSARSSSASVQKAAAISPPQPGVPIELKKSICTHCAVGCTVTAEVQNGVWTGQEPSWDSPINRGSHCAKGASVRELVHSDRRLKYPLKLVDGQWERVSWEDAIDGIGDKLLEIRESSGPESVYWMGSAKFSNEGTYLFRKLAALWGTNNQDHQARICHSTTVAGVANTWGYGAMTNSFNDIRNSKTMRHPGRQPGRGASDRHAAPAGRQGAQQGELHRHGSAVHPHGRARDRICRASRSGTDIAVLWGMLWHIFENGWEDKEFIAQRVYGMDEVRKEVAKYHARRGGAHHRRARRPAEARRRDVRDAEAGDDHLVHGPDAAHGRHRQRARELHLCAWPPAISASRAPAPTSSAAMTTCRARPTSGSMWSPCRSTTG